MLRALLVSVALLAIAGCAKRDQALDPLPQTATNIAGVASPRVNGVVASDRGVMPAPEIAEGRALTMGAARTPAIEQNRRSDAELRRHRYTRGRPPNSRRYPTGQLRDRPRRARHRHHRNPAAGAEIRATDHAANPTEPERRHPHTKWRSVQGRSQCGGLKRTQHGRRRHLRQPGRGPALYLGPRSGPGCCSPSSAPEPASPPIPVATPYSSAANRARA